VSSSPGPTGSVLSAGRLNGLRTRHGTHRCGSCEVRLGRDPGLRASPGRHRRFLPLRIISHSENMRIALPRAPINLPISATGPRERRKDGASHDAMCVPDHKPAAGRPCSIRAASWTRPVKSASRRLRFHRAPGSRKSELGRLQVLPWTESLSWLWRQGRSRDLGRQFPKRPARPKAHIRFIP
jgi:hypothetical protein